MAKIGEQRFSPVTPLAPRPPTVRSRAPSSSPVVAGSPLHDQVSRIKSPELPSGQKVNLPCLGQGPGAPLRTGPHNQPPYPSNRPKISLCLLEITGLVFGPRLPLGPCQQFHVRETANMYPLMGPANAHLHDLY